MAQQVAHFLKRPYARSLGLHRHLLPVPYLSLEEQHRDVDIRAVKIRSPKTLVNKNVLLIHDTHVTGRALLTSAQALVNSGALNVWGMSVVLIS